MSWDKKEVVAAFGLGDRHHSDLRPGVRDFAGAEHKVPHIGEGIEKFLRDVIQWDQRS